MTAVASPPSLQTLSRLGWAPSNGPGGLDGSSTNDIPRGFASRTAPRRTNAASASLAGDGDIAASPPDADAAAPIALDHRSTAANPPSEQPHRISTKSGRTLWTASATDSAGENVHGGGGGGGAAPQYSHPGGLQEIAKGILPSVPRASSAPRPKQMQAPQQLNGGRMAMQGQPNADPPVLLVLLPVNGTFERKQITVPYFPDILRIGRQTNAKTVPTQINGYFDSKVLSRQHAEVWADRSGKVWIRDVKSSNGTFVNGVRLSPESRDSEPHELRENDMLELGIDIVSEDQKSIVHHKVSAKIEHAGVQTNASNVLDLNLGDIDPGAGGGLMGAMLPHGHLRGRSGSQGSVISNGSRISQGLNGNVNVMGVQRHMNAWLSPVSIEQVVKRLGNELKAAKEQAQDLHRTSDYFNAVLNAQPGHDLPKPPASILPPAPPIPQTNGVASHSLSAFSQPPAPPPQQPLPEKPDGAEDHHPLSSPKVGLSPSKSEIASSQILSLTEALAVARKEIDSQGSRVRYLEEMLRQERKARETAEQRARLMLEQNRARGVDGGADEIMDVSLGADESFDPSPAPSLDSDRASMKSNASDDTIMIGNEAPFSMSDSSVPVETSLQERLTLVLVELDEMKLQMETYKRRAETAEEERGTLAEMVTRIRQENANGSSGTGCTKRSRSRSGGRRGRSNERDDHLAGDSTAAVAGAGAIPAANGSARSSDASTHHVVPSKPWGLEKSPTMTQAQHDALATTTTSQQQPSKRQLQLLHNFMARALDGDPALAQAAPYASMLGVVLLGVGIMAYLNGLQGKVER